MYVVLTSKNLLAVMVKNILRPPFSTVGLSLGILNSSSNPRATSLALTCPSFEVKTHLVDSLVCPSSITSVYVSKFLSFSSSFCLARNILSQLVFSQVVELTHSSPILSQGSLPRSKLFDSFFSTSFILYQLLLLPEALPALPRIVAFIQFSSSNPILF